MKKTILISFVALMVASLEAATYRVTHNAPGGGDGQSWATPMTIVEAIGKIADGDTILCKAGVYTPTAALPKISKAIKIKGGLAGTDEDDEALAKNGERSIFDPNNNTSFTTFVDIVTVSEKTTLFEGVEFRNVYARAVSSSGYGSLSFTNCVFDSCGRKCPISMGGTVRGFAGRFETSGTTAKLSFDNCVFSRNTYDLNSSNMQVGYGMAISFKGSNRVTINNSLFVSNGMGRASLLSTKDGNGVLQFRGAAIYSESPVTICNTEFRANRAGISDALGGVVYVKETGKDSAFTNCLFLANSCEYCSPTVTRGNNGVLVFRAKSAEKMDVINCTFAYNFTDGKITSAGIDIGKGTGYIRNTIFYGGQKKQAAGSKDIYLTASGAIANVDYCLFEENAKDNLADYILGSNGTLNMGSNNVFGDPKFARAITADEIDSVMVSNKYNNTVWYYGYSADAYETVFSKADVHAMNRKLTVDTGDPASPYSNETRPNGARVNLGYYGNTTNALSTLSGMKIIIR